jgi:hypothetical protein
MSNNIILHMLCTCWIVKATHALTIFKTFDFQDNNGFTKFPECYVIRILRLLFNHAVSKII